ncbi:hypothetical protein VKT23_001708 [Stygiomarasmius scandens]|uniref:Uncharacterized protein n=1 Tax=Marasmiellus scandens TaxID=2682957 RepID=A0ABR1JZR0_9AGAR
MSTSPAFDPQNLTRTYMSPDETSANPFPTSPPTNGSLSANSVSGTTGTAIIPDPSSSLSVLLLPGTPRLYLPDLHARGHCASCRSSACHFPSLPACLSTQVQFSCFRIDPIFKFDTDLFSAITTSLLLTFGPLDLLNVPQNHSYFPHRV